MVTLDVELYMFCVALATGAVLAVCGDVYRAVRDAWTLRGLAAAVCDLAFALVAAAVLALGLVLGSWGALRLAVLAGVLAGVALYAALASPVVYPGVRRFLARVAAAVHRARAALARAWAAWAARRAAWARRQAEGLTRLRAAAAARVRRGRSAEASRPRGPLPVRVRAWWRRLLDRLGRSPRP